jgi:hypothetical protein
MAGLPAGATHAFTSRQGYRSPSLLAGSKDVFALRGSDVMRVPGAGGETKRLYSVEAS